MLQMNADTDRRQCEARHLLEKEVESWTEAINKRNDPATRREHQHRSRGTPYLMPDDVASLNRVAEEHDKDGRASDTLAPTETRKDMLRVEMIVPLSIAKPPPSRPKYTTGYQPRKTRKRRRPQGEEEDGTRAKD